MRRLTKKIMLYLKIRKEMGLIKNFKHRGLENFFIDGSVAGINPQHAKKLRMILAMLNSVKEAKEMHTPGMRFHGLVCVSK